MEQQWFRVAAPDGRVLGITLIFAGLTAWFVFQVGLALAQGRDPDRFDLGLGAVLLAVVLFRLAQSVRGYRLQTTENGPVLWIVRRLPVAARGVPLKRLSAVRYDPQLPPILNAGLLSMGGLFGWAGRGMLSSLGPVDVYGTNNRKAVVLEFVAAREGTSAVGGGHGPVYILTPDDPPALVSGIKALRAGSTPPGPAIVTARPADSAPAAAPPDLPPKRKARR